jgi:hypothetical protein
MVLVSAGLGAGEDCAQAWPSESAADMAIAMAKMRLRMRPLESDEGMVG